MVLVVFYFNYWLVLEKGHGAIVPPPISQDNITVEKFQKQKLKQRLGKTQERIAKNDH